MTRFNSFSFDDVDYTYCRQTKEIIGMMTPKGNPYVRVTDVESTLLDCFDRIDRAGGIEELLQKDIDGVIIEPSKSQIFCKHTNLYDKLDEYNIPYVFIQGCICRMCKGG